MPSNDFMLELVTDAQSMTSGNEIFERELTIIQHWTGIRPRIYQSTRGTYAQSDYSIHIDIAQLHGLFGHLDAQSKATAVFLALAHEFGHLLQIQKFGLSQLGSISRIEIEANADIVAGVWLGVRLNQGQPRYVEHVMSAAMQLKEGLEGYPSPYQRGQIILDGMSKASWLIPAESNIKANDEGYISITQSINRSDLEQLMEISNTRLRDTPNFEP